MRLQPPVDRQLVELTGSFDRIRVQGGAHHDKFGRNHKKQTEGVEAVPGIRRGTVGRKPLGGFQMGDRSIRTHGGQSCGAGQCV